MPLAEHALALSAGPGGVPKRLSPAVAARLIGHPWPGNARELRNAMERVAALVRQPVVSAADLHFLGAPAPAAPEAADWLAGDLPTALARLGAAMIRRALAASLGNRAETARRRGIHRQLLHARLDPSGNRTPPVGSADGEGTPNEK